MDQIDISSVEKLFASSGSRLYSIAETTVRDESMLDLLSSGVVVGLSGGADSVFLLCFLLEYRRRNNLDFSIIASHINHGIRGDEADRDESFCVKICTSLGIEIIVDRYCIPIMAKNAGCSIEESARIVRYNVFSRIISGRNDIGCVAVAHNMSDSVETVIFNILRGSGARGASGIRPVRDEIVRPLIKIKKEEIHQALDKVGFPYVTDSTNLSNDYTRNYIRRQIVPSFDQISSDPERMIARFADNLRTDDDFIDQFVNRFFEEHKIIRNTDLISLHGALFVRVMKRMAEKAGASISYRILSDIRALLNKDNFSYSLIGKAAFICERGECRVSRDTTEGADFCFAVEEGINDLSPLNAVLILTRTKDYKTFSNVYKNSIQANLSSAIIKGSLYLRPKKDGDTVYYGGMTHKIKKLFSDAKIPRSKRKLIPILCDDSGVVWVPGFGVRDDSPTSDQKKDVFVILGINSERDTEDEARLYSASEFRT